MGRRIFVGKAAPVYRGKKIEVARVLYQAGAEVKRHASPCEQVHSIIAGKAQYRVGAEEAIEDLEGTTKDCKDIVPGFSVYNARWEK